MLRACVSLNVPSCVHARKQELRAERAAVEAKTAELEEKQVELDRLKYRAKLEVCGGMNGSTREGRQGE